MSIINKVACPHCHATLKTARPLPLGKQVKCPGCSQMFTVTSEALQEAAGAASGAASSAKGGAAGPQPVADVSAIGVAPDGLSISSQPSGNRKPALILMLVGCLLFLGAGAGLAYFCFSSAKPDDSDKQASREGSNAERGSKSEKTGGKPGGTDEPSSLGAFTRETGPVSTLPEDEQKDVAQAIEHGVAWLKKAAHPTGSWNLPSGPYRPWRGTSGPYEIGYATFPGMTLLMCGVPANDPVIQHTVKFVREHADQLSATYELSLTIMFLDQLADPKDRPLIQTLALRLMAGQQASGGWGYTCPPLSPADQQKLVAVLKDLRSQDAWADIAGSISGQDKLAGNMGGAPVNDSKLVLKKPADAAALPPALKNLPLLQEQKIKETFKPDHGQTDNSNTQFALLALWIARKYDIPLDRSMTLVSRRFRTSQRENGTWGYHYERAGQYSPAMNCAGLLGLAVGHGVASDVGGKALPPLKDPAVQRALHALTEYVGTPGGKGNKASLNLYFLWSLERVAVVYNLSKFGDKDWYRWGSQILVATQAPDGHWANAGYHGASHVIDTCMALLVLKRANVVSDLTDKLQLFTDAGR